MFEVRDQVRLNGKGLGWARWPTKHKDIYQVTELFGINAHSPNDKVTPINKVLRSGRVVFCGLINTDMLVKV